MAFVNKFIIMRTFIKDKRESNSRSIKIRNYNYGGEQKSPSSHKFKRYNENEPNPIKVVVDMIGEDGTIHQEIINQNYELQQRPIKTTPLKFTQPSPTKRISLPIQSLSYNFSKQVRTDEQVRSFVFNRYNYDNYKSLPISNSRKSLPSKRRVSNPSHKNIEIVFCENKLPQFVAKTNEKIEEIYKQEKIIENTVRKQTLRRSQHQSTKNTTSIIKPAAKTSFANCIKQYATLQKLSVFMENQRNLKSKHFCHSTETDPSRNLLLDIITHRFSFLKNINKKIRDRIYRSLLARQINNQSKINIQEYMKLYQMFVGRDAKPADIATFLYIFLFGNQVPSLQLAEEHLQRLNGQISRLRIVLKEIQLVLERSEKNIVENFCMNQKLLKHFIDYILER